MNKIAIFASGSGSNAENIITHFSTGKNADVVALFVNNPNAGVIIRAARLSVPVVLFDRNDLYGSGKVLEQLRILEVDFIVLAGFLWLIPGDLLDSFRGRIVNIHPALLPDFGGRGMYGDRVHRAVIASGSKVSGITIHFVNERYDEGDIIFRAECEVWEDDTPETLAARIHELEYRYYPSVIEKLLKDHQLSSSDIPQ
ncbi:MAG: phosphoribosylglycinamide formyltransferase [Bacteroidales bacterium]|jgi:phosphoribosylglycinamide formyltransferase-1|nr:phosphoribosylglycinamide formyltransferase [Bacteroidales bacterium]